MGIQCQSKMDDNIKELLRQILFGCKNWTTNRKGLPLTLSYDAVEELYDLLTELEDIIKGYENENIK